MQVDFFLMLDAVLKAQNFGLITRAPEFEGLEQFDFGFRRTLHPAYDYRRLGQWMMEQTPVQCSTLAKDEYGVSYTLIRFAQKPDHLVVIGPYALRPAEMLRLQNEHLPQQAETRQISERFSRLLSSKSGQQNLAAVSAMLSIATQNNTLEHRHCTLPVSSDSDSSEPLPHRQPASLSATLLEPYNTQEDALANAITRGDTPQALITLQNMEQLSPISVNHSVLHEVKYYLFTLNTIIRRAASRAMADSYMIGTLTAQYLQQIDAVTDWDAGQRLLQVMVHDYCSCVKESTQSHYTPPIQKVVNYIHTHLDGSLSLRVLADYLGINASYLSDLFKREVGVTITEYITTRRIHQAEELLVRTNLPVSVIAQDVGFSDFNYFTKLFKQAQGVPPTQFRKNKRESLQQLISNNK